MAAATEKLVPLRDFANATKKGAPLVNYLNNKTGELFVDADGTKLLRKLAAVDYICADREGRPLRDESDRVIPLTELSDMAARHMWQSSVNASGRKMALELSTPDKDGRLVTMDLSPTDVHTAATLPTFVGGYSIEEGIADAISPVHMVPHQQDVYFTWNDKSDFNRKIPNSAAFGRSVPKVNPSLTPTTYNVVPYALGGYIPTEVQANADTPLRPFEKLMQMIVDGLRLEREIRVATLLQTSSNWNTNMVTTLLSGAQWDGGGAADPLYNLQYQDEQSLKDCTGVAMSKRLWNWFRRSPAIQKFTSFKDRIPGIADMAKLTAELELPPIHIGKMKYYTAGGTPTFVWGNHVVLVRQPPQMPPTSQMDNVTSMTFRWAGLDSGDNKVPDGAVTGGLLVRSWFDQRLGPRGSTVVVATHSDYEAQTSGLVGGLILNAYQ